MKKLILILALITWLHPTLGLAALLTTKIDHEPEKVGDKFKLEVWLKGEGSDINALEGMLIWPDDKLKLLEIEEAPSIIGLWIKRPEVVDNNSLKFSGLLPGGFLEESGQLLSLNFEILKKGELEVRFDNTLALLNDGKGTPVSLTVDNLILKVGSSNLGSKKQILFIILVIISLIILWFFRRRKKVSV
ncbi:MAG: hypothetical protein AAB455_01775 [Patescibacteria group bacterium]